MQDLVLISIPETTIKNIVEQAVKKALSEYEATKDHADQKTVFNFSEACQYLGISESHGYRLTSKGQIPFSKRGKRNFFNKAKLDEWLLANEVPTSAELAEKASACLQKKGGYHV